MMQELFQEESNKKQTFVIQVMFQQNATWQGTITWTDKKKVQNFRSAMEMLKLMDEALQSEQSEESVNWE